MLFLQWKNQSSIRREMWHNSQIQSYFVPMERFVIGIASMSCEYSRSNFYHTGSWNPWLENESRSWIVKKGHFSWFVCLLILTLLTLKIHCSQHACFLVPFLLKWPFSALSVRQIWIDGSGLCHWCLIGFFPTGNEGLLAANGAWGAPWYPSVFCFGPV